MPTYDMTITMISPVHVGSGQEITPLEYVITSKTSASRDFRWLCAINTSHLLARLTDEQRAEFIKAAEAGGVRLLRDFIRKTADLSPRSPDVLWRAVVSEDLADAYDQALQPGAADAPAELAVVVMTRHPADGTPYLPGSSIKGALRTAWIAHQYPQYNGPLDPESVDHRKTSAAFEALILGHARDARAAAHRARSQGRRGNAPRIQPELRADPFRALRVGDAVLRGQHTNRIDRAVIRNLRRRPGTPDPAGIHMFYDRTFSLIEDPDNPVIATGRLTIDQRLAETPGPRHEHFRWEWPHCVASPIDADALLAAARDFYRRRLEDELQRFAPFFRDDDTGALRHEADNLDDSEALLRLGRFSHCECMTVPYRDGTPRKTGNTRTLTSDLPMGWVKIRLTPAS